MTTPAVLALLICILSAEPIVLDAVANIAIVATTMPKIYQTSWSGSDWVTDSTAYSDYIKESAQAKIDTIESDRSYKRSLRVSGLTLTSTGAIDTTSKDYQIISNYNEQIKMYASVISTGIALTAEQNAELEALRSALIALKS